MNEDAAFCTGFCTVALVVGALVMHGCHEVESTEREAMKAGLIEKFEPHSSLKVWTKPK